MSSHLKLAALFTALVSKIARLIVVANLLPQGSWGLASEVGLRLLSLLSGDSTTVCFSFGCYYPGWGAGLKLGGSVGLPSQHINNHKSEVLSL